MTGARSLRRLGGFVSVMMISMLAVASPAAAHADLSRSDPEAGGSVVDSPRQVTLTYTEGVSMRSNGVRLLDSDGADLEVGAPNHPGGRSEVMRASLPKLADGQYVVVWQATSEDSHPIRGSFTFTVGTSQVSGGQAEQVAKDALSAGAGDSGVGIALGVARFGVFVGLALLLGAAGFVVVLWPEGAADRRVRTLLIGALSLTALATAMGFLLQGPYTSAGGFGDVVASGQVAAVWDTRFGKVWVLRLALLVIAAGLVRGMVRRPGPKSRAWLAVATVTAVAIATTPGLSGHGSVGRWAALALVADVLHVLAMAVWLGGLVMLSLARSDERAYPRIAERFSLLAFGAVIVLVVTGSFQAIRQLEAISALWNSDYGRILLVKLIAFALLIGIAALSRRLVHGRALGFGSGNEPTPAATGTASAAGPEPTGAEGGVATKTRVGVTAPAPALHGLKRTVRAELVVGAIVLGLTSMLVNTPPPKVVTTSVPLQEAINANGATFDTYFGPARVGQPNSLHVSVLDESGKRVKVLEMRASISMPDEGIERMPIALTDEGDHFVADDIQVPFPGKWTLEMHALLSQVDEVTASTTVSVG